MGRASREKPARLAEKLLQIRTALGLSQNGMLKSLGIAEKGYRNYISDFENGVREPSLPVLLKYARLAGVPMDVLVDDDLDVPEHLPTAQTSGWVMKQGKMRYEKARR
jgi:transcriptional regulator with XRE-family HTH domain